MKLLIITQKINKNDPILGFFHGWIKEFSKHFDTIVGICLEKGDYDLPDNVKVLSLGKEEENVQFFRKLRYTIKFWLYIWRERSNYDAVFVHMNPVYILIGSVLWKFLRKKVYLWYTHKEVDLKLGLSVVLVNKIFSASKESFRIASSKLMIMGHGIDTDFFHPDNNINKDQDIISVGRISPTKNQLIMIKALSIVREKRDANLTIVGDGITSEDGKYKDDICKIVQDLNLKHAVFFKGSISPDRVHYEYGRSKVMINLSKTGGLDKAVLEAMACGINVLTSNEAFGDILPEVNICTNDPVEVAEKLVVMLNGGVGPELRRLVVDNHNLTGLINRLSLVIKNESNSPTK